MNRYMHSGTAALIAALLAAGTAGAQTTTAEPVDPAAEPVEAPAQPVEGQIETQEMDSLLASDLIGATVYAPDDETVGEISDVILTMDEQVEGVVVGVGGFLGIGEKDVAIEMSALQMSMTPENDVRIVLSSTRADLEAAPAFMSAADQRAEREAAAARAEMEATTPAVGVGGTAAPLDPMAPADPAATPADPADATTPAQ